MAAGRQIRNVWTYPVAAIELDRPGGGRDGRLRRRSAGDLGADRPGKPDHRHDEWQGTASTNSHRWLLGAVPGMAVVEDTTITGATVARTCRSRTRRARHAAAHLAAQSACLHTPDLLNSGGVRRVQDVRGRRLALVVRLGDDRDAAQERQSENSRGSAGLLRAAVVERARSRSARSHPGRASDWPHVGRMAGTGGRSRRPTGSRATDPAVSGSR